MVTHDCGTGEQCGGKAKAPTPAALPGWWVEEATGGLVTAEDWHSAQR